MLREIGLAFGFLTTLPLPHVQFTAEDFSRSARWYPLVGAGIGSILAIAHLTLARIFPEPLVALSTIGLWALLTGGLHLDGLADCCDGLLAPVDAERRLQIMRDPRLGSFGTIGLVLFLGFKWMALAAIAQPLPALLLATVWARWFVLPIAYFASPADRGLGHTFAGSLTSRLWLQALIVPLLALWLAPGARSLISITIAMVVVWGVSKLAIRRLGHISGDIMGMIIELGELLLLLGFAAR